MEPLYGAYPSDPREEKPHSFQVFSVPKQSKLFWDDRCTSRNHDAMGGNLVDLGHYCPQNLGVWDRHTKGFSYPCSSSAIPPQFCEIVRICPWIVVVGGSWLRFTQNIDKAKDYHCWSWSPKHLKNPQSSFDVSPSFYHDIHFVRGFPAPCFATPSLPYRLQNHRDTEGYAGIVPSVRVEVCHWIPGPAGSLGMISGSF